MLATLEEVKNYLQIGDSDNDTLLTSLLKSSDAFIKNYTGRDFEATDYTDIFNGKGERKFLLKQFPIISLTSFQYNSGTFSNEVWEDFDNDSYKVEKETGMLLLLFCLTVGIQNIKVIYRAGYNTIPADIRQATIQLTAFYYNSSKSDGIIQEHVEGTGLTYEKTSIPDNIKIILNNYKNVSTF